MTGMIIEAGIAENITKIITENIMMVMVIIADSEVASLDRQSGGPDGCAVMEHCSDACLVTIRKVTSSSRKEDTMKSSIRDKAEGTFHEVKGKAKEVAGKLSDNPKLRAEGTVERVAGKVQEKIGQVKKALGK
jgi:uncharacterized protein YjbJ (UPF0337 family)